MKEKIEAALEKGYIFNFDMTFDETGNFYKYKVWKNNYPDGSPELIFIDETNEFSVFERMIEYIIDVKIFDLENGTGASV
jgi:predicted AAA+ superfamily ATPase